MAYADNRMSRSRMGAIFIVALLHALLGYALITGLAYNVVKKVAADLKTFNVEEEPPPPEEKPPPPPPDQPQTPPPVVTPPPIVRTNTPPPPMVTTNIAPPPQMTYTAPPAPPAPPAPAPPPPPPPPPKKVTPARAKANLASLFSDEDYPASAVRAGESGATGFRLEVGANGRVTNCTVTSSSGSSALDSTTCRLLRSRARFTPATDSSGGSTSDSVSGRIVWRLPAD
ncbi:MAG TPA: TonB family protein [Allosphingosinicella sp.]